jgi:BirA family transcriptional regulator, biotin operon repressor / biotin---[acetyl-CoA-carboxylase] ligase
VIARTIRYEAIDSTNAEAHRLAAAGEREPLWITAESQSAGRGRMGRSWVSEPGNLYATLLLTIEGDARTASQLSFVAALAMRDVAAALRNSEKGFALKWPNDVLLNGAKICGILAETLLVLAPGALVVGVGMGLNLAHAPQGTPYPVAALGAHVSPADALGILQARFADGLALWNHGEGFSTIRENWFAHAIGKRGRASINMNGTPHEGVFAGLAADGALILEKDDNSTMTIHAGDIRFAELDALRAQP